MATAFDPEETVERFFTVIKSLNEFDQLEVRGMIQTLLSRSRRDLCFLGSYYRAVGNIESTLSLKALRDFQAIAMLARSLFEIAVDITLAAQTPDCETKIIAFVDLEKLRSARKIVEFKTANPVVNVDATTYQDFIDNNTSRIATEAKALWPRNYQNVAHWSALKLEKRIETLGAPFTQIYAVNYPQLSWYVHSGMTGILNLEKDSFRMLAGVAFTIIAESYMLVLAAVIKYFQIDKANDKILDMMTLAKMLPFTDGAAQAEELRRALLG